MILRGARIALDAETTAQIDLGIELGRLLIPPARTPGPEFDCRGLLVLPGLINAHDHLEFGLFPRLGLGPYLNASDWARDIHRPDEPPVQTHLRVVKDVRLMWGGLRNLVCGVTTVMHHNPYDPVFDGGSFPVRVLREFGWAHSLAFSSDVGERYCETPREQLFFIHAAEGTDRCSESEIPRLSELGVLGPNTVIIHGVGMDQAGLDLIRQRGAAIVWCPTSNRFMLGRTLAPCVRDSGVPVALGTDSAMTASGDMADELSAASQETSWNRLYRMITSDAAAILRLANGEGEIHDGGIADLLVLRDLGRSPAYALTDLDPELVFVGGRLKLISASAAPEWAAQMPYGQRLRMADRGSFIVDCDVAALWQATIAALGEEPRLAGRLVAI